MKMLIADDEIVSRRMLESLTRRWGYEPVVASDGLEASRILHQPDAPKLALLDWMMPGLDGLELCRALRTEKKDDAYVYILLLTAKHAKEDVIEGLEAGADDYIVKPFDSRELQVRLRSGKRVLYLLEQLTTARDAARARGAGPADEPVESHVDHRAVGRRGPTRAAAGDFVRRGARGF